MLLLIRQLTGQNRSYLPPFPSLSVHPRASHSPCRYRFRQATRGRAREAGRQPAHLGPSKVAPSLILRRPLLFGNPSQDPPISLENTHYTTDAMQPGGAKVKISWGFWVKGPLFRFFEAFWA